MTSALDPPPPPPPLELVGPAPGARVLTIGQRWGGPIELASDTAGLEGLIIRDDAAYDALRARLPAQRVQQRQPAPPSTDPLRAWPALDFATQMLVVVTRSGSLTPPLLAQVLAEPQRLVVRCAVDDPPPEARPYGLGGYAAALVARADGPLALVGPRLIEDAAALADAVGELVTLRGPLALTQAATLLGVAVDAVYANAARPAEATGWLERADLSDEGAEVHYRLRDPLRPGLALARHRW